MMDIVKRLRVEFDQWTPDPTFDTRIEAADTIEALKAVLQDVRAYNKGDGRFNFSTLSNYDRENASYDAWQEIAERIDETLAKAGVQ
jgi:hypothetical protein